MKIHPPVIHPLYKWIVCDYTVSSVFSALPGPLQSAVTAEEAEQGMLYVTTDHQWAL